MRLLAAALAVPLLVPAAASEAAVPTCHGLAATIVGTPNAQLVGTDGPDVIVTEGARSIDAGAGDDHVCVTGDAERVFAQLGLGSDEYDGGAGADVVTAGGNVDYGVPYPPNAGGYEIRDPAEDVDVVRTGAGADYVQSGGLPTGTTPGLVVTNGDLIDLGAGADEVRLHGSAPSGGQPVVEGGPGRDRYIVEDVAPAAPQVGTLDVGAGEVTYEGRVLMRFASFEQFGSRLTGTTPVHLLGGPGPDELRFDTLPPGSVVDGRGGDDVIEMEGRGVVVRGGPGTDKLTLRGDTEDRLRLDLAAGRLRVNGSASRAGSLERIRVRDIARPVIIGSSRPEQVVVQSCGALVRAGGGADTVQASGRCSRPDARLVGGAGDDRLVGSSGPDVLLGGPGRDRVEGRAGRDRCVAEHERSCER